MKQRSQSLLWILVTMAFIGCTSPSMVPQDPPQDWQLSIQTHGTTGGPSESDRNIFIYTSGICPGRISSFIPASIFNDNTPDGFKKKLSPSEMQEFYRLAQRAIREHRIGLKPDVPVCDGNSLCIRVDMYDRAVQIEYKHSGVLPPEANALLNAINAMLPNAHQVKWSTHTKNEISAAEQAGPGYPPQGVGSPDP